MTDASTTSLYENDQSDFTESSVPPNFADNSYYDNLSITDYDGVNVIYVGYIGIHSGEQLYVYGYTNRLFQKDCEEYRKEFDEVTMVYIYRTDNNAQIIDKFRVELAFKKLNRKLIINNKEYTDLFVPEKDSSYRSVIDILDETRIRYPLPALTELRDTYRDLQKDFKYKLLKKNHEIKLLKKDHEIELLEMKIQLLTLQLELQTK
jgi:hypothetical protein